MMRAIAAMETKDPAPRHNVADGDASPSKRAQAAEGYRRCLATRLQLGKADLLRFVIGPDNELVFDLKGDLPGRGFWVKADRAALDKAVARNLFAKAARSAISIPADFRDRVLSQLRRQMIDGLGLARRSGQAIAGFESVDRALDAGKIALLVEAADAGNDSRAKLARRAGDKVPVVGILTALELSQALGRDWAVHVGVKPGRIAETLLRHHRRYEALAMPAAPQGSRRSSSHSSPPPAYSAKAKSAS